MARHFLFNKLRTGDLKQLLRALLLFSCVIFLGYKALTYYLADGFSPSHVCGLFDPLPSTVHTHFDEKISHLLDQKFTYIGKGSQSFVFLGSDESTVLKFFRCNRYRSFLHSPIAGKMHVREEKWEKLMASCRIADEELKEESALLFLHLQKSCDLPQEIILEDKLKRSFTVNPNEACFIVQKRAQLLYPFLLECKECHDINTAQMAVSRLFQLINKRQKKGIGDRDAALSKNIGFLDGNPVFIDVGEFYYEKTEGCEQRYEMEKMASKITPWIAENYSEFLPIFQKAILGKLDEEFSAADCSRSQQIHGLSLRKVSF